MDIRTDYLIIKEFIWALCSHYGITNVPLVVTKHRNDRWVSGFCQIDGKTGSVIKVFVRFDPFVSFDMLKHAIMHEFAHACSIKKTLDKHGNTVYRLGHTDDFYNVLWSMVKWSGIDQHDSLELEMSYKPTRAKRMAIVHGIKGARNA